MKTYYVEIILKSGKELQFECSDYTITLDPKDNNLIRSLTFEGDDIQIPTYINTNEIAVLHILE